MELNALTIALIVLVALLVLFLLIKRNQKDKKEFEQDTIKSEIKPEQHDKEESV